MMMNLLFRLTTISLCIFAATAQDEPSPLEGRQQALEIIASHELMDKRFIDIEEICKNTCNKGCDVARANCKSLPFLCNIVEKHCENVCDDGCSCVDTCTDACLGSGDDSTTTSTTSSPSGDCEVAMMDCGLCMVQCMLN